MHTLVSCVEHHVSICCLLQYLFSVITLTGKAEPAIAVIGEEECEIQGWRSGCWGESVVCHGGQCVQTIHQMVVTSHSDSMLGRYSPSAEWCIIFIMVWEDWDITLDICYYHDSWQICPTIKITQADSVVVGYIHRGFVSLVLRC